MSNIESRPSRRGVWEYVFFIDIDGHRDEQNVAEAIAEIEEILAKLGGEDGGKDGLEELGRGLVMGVRAVL